MKLLRSMGFAVLIVSSGVMVHAQELSETEQALKLRADHETKKISLMGSCMSSGGLKEGSWADGTVQYDHIVFAKGPITVATGRMITTTELRDVLRECDAAISTEQNEKKQSIRSRFSLSYFSKEERNKRKLQQAMLAWKKFKDGEDLPVETSKAAKKIAQNRHDLMKAIDEESNNVGAIVRAAQKTLHYRNPTIDRLLKLIPTVRLSVAWEKKQS